MIEQNQNVKKDKKLNQKVNEVLHQSTHYEVKVRKDFRGSCGRCKKHFNQNKMFELALLSSNL